MFISGMKKSFMRGVIFSCNSYREHFEDLVMYILVHDIVSYFICQHHGALPLLRFSSR